MNHTRLPFKKKPESGADIKRLKLKCPMDLLLHHIGLGDHAKPACRSPFRSDQHASWGIYRNTTGWHFKDLATGDHGDELSLLARHLNIEEAGNYPVLVSVYQAIADSPLAPTKPKQSMSNETQERYPDRTGFICGTNDQLARLAQLRGLSVTGLQRADELGVLLFGVWNNMEVYAVTDQTGKVLELRRLNGEVFPAVGELEARKSHAVKFSKKSWPVGLLEACTYPNILLVEGMPDFLAAFDLFEREQKADWGVAALLSSGIHLSAEVLGHLAGKQVCIFGHADESHAGLKAMVRWERDLKAASINTQLIDVYSLQKATGNKMKDLNDYVRLLATGSVPLQAQGLLS